MGLASSLQCNIAARVIRKGGVIACPTESVWGLACDPYNAKAVRELLALKNRPESKGLILLSGQQEHFLPLLASLPQSLFDRFSKTNARPTTWLVPDSLGLVPRWVKGQHEKVAIRVSSHPAIKQLSARVGSPIVSTSANPSGKPTASNALRVRQYFDDELSYILPGSVQKNASPSQIIDLETNQILRH